VCLIALEFTDIAFAIDSIPAVFGATAQRVVLSREWVTVEHPCPMHTEIRSDRPVTCSNVRDETGTGVQGAKPTPVATRSDRTLSRHDPE